MEGFFGFTDSTIDFLWELRMNNSKAFMEENRARYKDVLKDPFDTFAKALAQRMGEASGEEVHFSVSRINRDVRYAKDKSPYRPCRWVVLKEPLVEGTSWKSRPVFYFELNPEGYDFGMGFYEATPRYMKAYRAEILGNEKAFSKIIKNIEKDNVFHLTGEDYKKVGGEDLAPDLRAWFTKKSFAVVGHGGIEDILFSGELVEYLVAQWKTLLPLQAYLRGIKEQA